MVHDHGWGFFLRGWWGARNSPWGSMGGGSHRETACDGDRLRSPLRFSVRWLQGVFGDQKALGGSGGFSSTFLMPSIAKESLETRAQLRARVAVLQVEIAMV
jgi:hypothetical protein